MAVEDGQQKCREKKTVSAAPKCLLYSLFLSLSLSLSLCGDGRIIISPPSRIGKDFGLPNGSRRRFARFTSVTDVFIYYIFFLLSFFFFFLFTAKERSTTVIKWESRKEINSHRNNPSTPAHRTRVRGLCTWWTTRQSSLFDQVVICTMRPKSEEVEEERSNP